MVIGKCLENITTYIDKNHISVMQVARDTGVSVQKLTGKSKENLNATEFLELCAYLNVLPEEMR